MRRINFYNFGQSLIVIIIVIVVVGLITTGGLYYYFQKQIPEVSETTEKPVKEVVGPEELPKEEPVPEEIIPSKPTISIGEVQSTIVALIEDLNATVEMADQGDISSVSESLRDYKENFASFISKSGQLDMKEQAKKEVADLRHKEWENYKLFLNLKQEVASYSQLSVEVADIENLIENHLGTQTLEATETLLMPKFRKTGYLDQNFLLTLLKNLLEKISVQAASEKNVIHKKVIIDPAYAKETWTMTLIQPCWVYESWIDLEANKYRQELHVSFSRPPGFEYIVESTDEAGRTVEVKEYCNIEVDLTDGETGKKLALNPYLKAAEWVDPIKGKHGIGEESTKDPYTTFKTKLEEEECYFDGTDIFEGKEVYKIKCPTYDINYRLYYIDAQTYLPIEEMVFEEILEYEWQQETKTSKVIHTGEMELIMAYKYIIGEIIERESLPSDFFELKIPAGYKFQDWAPYG
ncbi:MAG: hypothetical protein IB617_03025 [Candidatus Nealsonbacteria bacterium]|nr:MAG: hypothetical protein IB617_03025 [Candidatus Nealsonbacteria bacterium]